MEERKRRAAGANLQIAGCQIPGFQSPGCPSDEDELLYADEEDAGPDTLANAIFSRLFCVAFDRCVYPPAWIYEDELDSMLGAQPPLSDHNPPGESRARSTSGDNDSGEAAAEDTKPLYDVILEDDNDDNTKTVAMRPGNPWRALMVAPPPSPLAQSPRRRWSDDHAARVASTALMGDLDEWPLTAQAPPSDPHRRRSEPENRRSAVVICSSRSDRGSRSSRSSSSSSNGSNGEDPKIMRGAPWQGDDYLPGDMAGGVGGTD
ncbi:unnamed protein product [Ectocarpus sp. 13 AM-2016]